MNQFYKLIFGILTVCLPTMSSLAQSPRQILKKANTEIDWEQFEQATQTLAPLVKQNNPEATLLSGLSLLNTQGQITQAIKMLQKVVEYYPLKNGQPKEAIEARFYLGQALHWNDNCTEALQVFNELNAQLPKGTIKEEVEKEIEYCNNMMTLKQTPVNIVVEHMGEILNSAYEDHSPIVMYDESTIYFTSNRPVKGYSQNEPGFENIYVSYWRNENWTTPKILDIPNALPGNRATVSLTPDGQGLVFYQNDGRFGQLFITRHTFNGWSTPEKLPAPINSGNNETHASFSADGRTIFFSSDRPGGLGGKDIYISHMLPDGTWGEPLNPGPAINTPLDEEGPFIHPDGKTLYFSSMGHNSIGDYDIFSSVLNENGEWLKAQNIGFPMNTANDDLFYIPTPNGLRVYYASQQAGSLGASDLFIIHLATTDDRSLAVVASHVFDSKNQPAEKANIRVSEAESGESMGVFKVNPTTGKFIAIVPTGKKYLLNISCEGCKPITQEFNLPLRGEYGSTRRAIYLPAITLETEKGL